MTPYSVLPKFLQPWHFFCQILHTHVLNKDTPVDPFLCLILKYTKYDNIFINQSLKFWSKDFQPNAYQVKFSRQLLWKRVPKHINIKSDTFNVQSVRQPWTRMLAVAYESSGQPLLHVSEHGHSYSARLYKFSLFDALAYTNPICSVK